MSSLDAYCLQWWVKTLLVSSVSPTKSQQTHVPSSMGTSSTVLLEKNMKEAPHGHKTDAVRGNM